MAGNGSEWWRSRLIGMVALLVMASMYVVIKESSEHKVSSYKVTEEVETHFVMKVSDSPGHHNKSSHPYVHIWPLEIYGQKMKFGWKIVVGAIIGFFGAAFGSVGGVGGGGIFVPMLTLIIGFDQKSSTALSKCMIMGGAAATVFYNLRQRHPTLDLPIIDYNLALLFQPMLVLGISIGVSFNVIFAEWMITVLLIIIFIVMSTKAFLKGVETWKKETITKKEAAQRLQSNDVELRPLPEGQSNDAHTETKDSKKSEVQVSILENIYWKELGIIVAVWVVVLALQIAKNYTTTCSVPYWILNLLQIPVTVGATSYEAVGLYKGGRVIASRGEAGTNLRLHQLVLYCVCGIVAGIIGGLLGLGGGFILGPLFLELGIPPQVSSATATFAMAFSSSMSVVEYYLLKRFPHPYALYFFAVAIIAALVGQYVVTKVIAMIGRASLIIFILAVTIFISAILLGGVGIDRMIKKIEHKDHLGFYSLCK
ncbi:sulfite exporter TauE/SafE family protein 3-like isoform X3 [Quercus robur]|uniref:sulfite exporter TauE/SafE family protein 3-like isoform X3 n=1 Tax=Quercus robur TaxID=38942 RepID=UPI00216198FF|nr:sulfite exporter TauE/SafE family protein 3-like isoform X3 [Quercus robur]